VTGRMAGMPCREDKDVPREGEGTGEASRAMEACLLLKSGPGDLERTEEAIGIDRAGVRDEPSPLSAILNVTSGSSELLISCRCSVLSKGHIR
jgi:hypothetical protein